MVKGLLKEQKKVGQVTTLLNQWREGNQAAAQQLIPLVYQELRRIAAHYLQVERAEHTLQPTALVHELYIRLFSKEAITWESRAHFFGLAAKGMRHILIDHARSRKAEKRGGTQVRVSFTTAEGCFSDRDEYVLEVDRILKKLEKVDPRAAKVVELRFFGGLEESEAAEVLGVSIKTIARDWKFARAWLQTQLASARR